MDKLGSHEASAHRVRDGRIAQMARESIERFSQSVKVHPTFCLFLTAFAALRAAVVRFDRQLDKLGEQRRTGKRIILVLLTPP